MIEISLDQTPPAYRPGDVISGHVVWADLDEKTTSLVTRLIWHTEGKGDQDVSEVVRIQATVTARSGDLPFEFSAPSRPFSFSGKLISLIWSVEVVLRPSRVIEQKQITISGNGKEVVLDQSYEDSALTSAVRVSS